MEDHKSRPCECEALFFPCKFIIVMHELYEKERTLFLGLPWFYCPRNYPENGCLLLHRTTFSLIKVMQ